MSTNAKSNAIPKKTLPYSCTKSELYDMYRLDMSERAMRNGINTIIKEKRGLPKMHPVKLTLVHHVELMEFVATYGLPRHYEL